MRTALGLRAHSGWAVMVAAAGDVDGPVVLERRRIEIADPQAAASRQPYHAAAALPFSAAEALVCNAIESSRALAAAAIAGALRSLRAQGHEVAACAVLLGSGKPLPTLDKILASHALIHAAEGVMFRDVLWWAAEKCGLPVTGLPEKEVPETSLERLDSLGKSIGAPWTQDQKYATVAALMALGSKIGSCTL